MGPPLPECSEAAPSAAAAAAAAGAADDGVTSSSAKRQQQQQQQAPSSGRGASVLVVQAKPWSLAFDGSVPPSTNALASVKSRYPLDPPGYDTAIAKEPLVGRPPDLTRRREPDHLQKRQQALWALATSPAKGVALMMFMLYMMGNGLQIFSIIMTLSGLMGPAQAILRSAAAFPPDPDGKLTVWPPRLLYCLVHSVQLGFVLSKLAAMGLLPTEPSDWLSWAPAPAPAFVTGAAL